MSLYAAHRLGRIPGREEREVWGGLFAELGEGTVRAGSELRRPAARRQAQEARQRPQEPQGGAEPPGAGAALLRALWAVCGPLAGAAADDRALACLQARQGGAVGGTLTGLAAQAATTSGGAASSWSGRA